MVEYHFTSNPGINYGFTSNVDTDTGIRYGVISLNAVNEYVQGDFEPDFGLPSCPNCSTSVADSSDNDSPVQDLSDSERYSSFDFTAQCGVYQCTDCSKVYYPMELISDLELEAYFRANPQSTTFPAREGDSTPLESTTYSSFSAEGFVSPCCLEIVEKVTFKHESSYSRVEDYVCLYCKLLFSNESAYPEEPYAHTYERDGYRLMLDSSNDIWVLKSPYATYAQYCSPCAPGAGYLTHPTKEGEGAFCYALDDSFFDTRPDSSNEDTEESDNEGESDSFVDSDKAYRPYPLYNLEGERIQD